MLLDGVVGLVALLIFYVRLREVYLNMDDSINKKIQNDLSAIIRYATELQENAENIRKVELLEDTVRDLTRRVKNHNIGYYVATYQSGYSFDYSSVVYEPLGYMTYTEAFAFFKSIDLKGEELFDCNVIKVSKKQYRDFLHLRYLTKAFNALNELERFDKKHYINDDIPQQIIELREKLDIPVYAYIH